MSVPVTGEITTYAGGTYATGDLLLQLPSVVADAAGLNAITAGRRRQGMIVIVQADLGDGTFMAYQLTAASPWAFTSADWTLWAPGGGGGITALTGDVTASGTGSVAATLATVNANVGTFNTITVNAKGLATAASNTSYLTANQTITLSSDATGSGTTSITVTLATVNSNVGSFGSSTAIPALTVNAKGLVTAASTNVVIAPAGTLTGTTLASNVVTSSLTTVATIGAGTWQGTAIATAYLGATVRTFTAILGQGVPVAVGTNAAGNYLICSNAGTFARWDLAAVTAPVGASLVIDVLKSSDHGSTWATIWSTTANRPTLTTTVNNAGGTAFDVTTFSAGDWLRFDVITVGSSTAGQNVTLEILGHMNQ